MLTAGSNTQLLLHLPAEERHWTWRLRSGNGIFGNGVTGKVMDECVYTANPSDSF